MLIPCSADDSHERSRFILADDFHERSIFIFFVIVDVLRIKRMREKFIFINNDVCFISLKLHLGSVVQGIVRLTFSLMPTSFTVVTKVFLNTIIFFLQKCE